MKQSMRVWIVVLVVLSMVSVMEIAAGANADPKNFTAHLNGDQEFPPVETDAVGQALFGLSGTMVSYRLTVSNIENVIAAHIHCGAFGANGPVVQFLYGTVPAGGGPFDGILSSETFDSTESGTCADMPLIDAMRAELTYANVHTDDGDPETSGGAGDTPSGEIRGQIIPRG